MTHFLVAAASGDLIGPAVFNLVLWLVLRSIVAALIVVTGWGIGIGVAAWTNRIWPAITCAVIGWVVAVVWEIVALVNVFTDIVHIIQLAN
jgi:hypothetical protein